MGGVHYSYNHISAKCNKSENYIASMKPMFNDVKQNNVKALVIVYY